MVQISNHGLYTNTCHLLLKPIIPMGHMHHYNIQGHESVSLVDLVDFPSGGWESVHGFLATLQMGTHA